MKSRLRLRLRPRHVAMLAIASCVFLIVWPAQAQDAVQGKRLFEDTVNVSGINTLTGACTSCHGTVANRRAKISGGDPLAEISQATASERFRLAMASVSAMNQFEALNPQQVQDIAAYLADTPKRSVARLDFDALAINVASAAQFVELRNSVATAESLHVTAVSVDGTNAARFTRTADTCDQQSLPPGGVCRVTLRYAAADTALASAALGFTLRQGNATTEFSRSVALAGAVGANPPPTPAPAPADAGGGALSLAWLAGQALGVALLLSGPRQRRPNPIRDSSPSRRTNW